MKFVRLCLKFATLASSVTLFAGFVAFRAGALNGFVTAAALTHQQGPALDSQAQIGALNPTESSASSDLKTQAVANLPVASRNQMMAGTKIGVMDWGSTLNVEEMAQFMSKQEIPGVPVNFGEELQRLQSMPIVLDRSMNEITLVITDNNHPLANSQFTDYSSLHNLPGQGSHNPLDGFITEGSNPKQPSVMSSIMLVDEFTGMLLKAKAVLPEPQTVTPSSKRPTVMPSSKGSDLIAIPADVISLNAIPTSATPIVEDLAPLSQSSTFSQPPQEVVIGAMVSTKSAVLNWAPPRDYLDGKPIFVEFRLPLDPIFGVLSQPPKPRLKEPTRTVIKNGRPVVISSSKSFVITDAAPNTLKRIDDYIDNHLAKQSAAPFAAEEWPPTFTPVLPQALPASAGSKSIDIGKPIITASDSTSDLFSGSVTGQSSPKEPSPPKKTPTVMPSSKAGIGININLENVK